MAHTTTRVLFGTKFAVAIIQWTAYTLGGESFTLAEFGLTAPLVAFWTLQTHGDTPENASQYLDLSTVKTDGKIRVMQISSPDTEQPTGPLDYRVLAVVQGT